MRRGCFGSSLTAHLFLSARVGNIFNLILATLWYGNGVTNAALVRLERVLLP